MNELHDLHRPLGSTGLMVSPLGLGTVKLGRDQGVKYPSGFTNLDPSANQLIRFGWLVKRVSGTGVLPAVIGGELEFGRV